MRGPAELNRKLRAARELRSVVRTMKLLAAASLPGYERAVDSLEESVRVVEGALRICLRDRPVEVPPDRHRLAGVAFGSDHGLCGAFNEVLAARVREAAPAPLLAVGLRLAPALRDRGLEVAAEIPAPGSVAGISNAVQEVLLHLEGVERLAAFHHRPLPGGGFQPLQMQLLPVDPEWLRSLVERPWEGPTLPLPAQPPEVLLPAVLRQRLFLELYRAQARSLAAESAARLMAMQSAERNLDERTEELTLEYHRARQTAVTGEMLDVVAGYEALEGR